MDDDETTQEIRRRRAAVDTGRLDGTPQTQRLPQPASPEPASQSPAAPSIYHTPYGQYEPQPGLAAPPVYGSPPPPVHPMQQPPAHPVQQYVPQPVMPPPAYTSVVATGRPAASGVVIAIAWILALVTGFYLVPWALAATRNKSNQTGIFVVNLLLGWTVIGWIVALVMACGTEPQTNVVVVNHVPPQYYR